MSKKRLIQGIVLTIVALVLSTSLALACSGNAQDGFVGDDCGPAKAASAEGRAQLTASEMGSLQGADLDNVMNNLNDFSSNPEALKGLKSSQMAGHLDQLKGHADKLDAGQYSAAVAGQTGTTATIDTSAGDVGGSTIPGGMHFDSLPNAKFNDAVFTNAHDVVVNRASTCGKDAEGLLVGASFHGNVNEFCVTGNRIDIKHADEVMIPSNGNVWSTQNINSATLIVNDRVHVTSHVVQTVSVRDFASHDLKLTFQVDSSASFAKDASDITLDATTAGLSNAGDFISTEIADGSNNGSARLDLDRLTKKVLYVEMNPVFSYVLKTGKAETDLAFRAQ